LWLRGTPETASNSVVTALPTQIPYSTKQGIILAEQGIILAEQGISEEEHGILQAKTEIIAGCDFSEIAGLMSALPPRADMCGALAHVRFG